ncbi:MAG: hypothetical protein IJJ07_02770 [Lachnospiraceae bacterium]|nr:hypothetical protein [Lachnospiraceae bacterium]
MAKLDNHNDKELLKKENLELDSEMLDDVTGGSLVGIAGFGDEEEDPNEFQYPEPITIVEPISSPAKQDLSKKKNRVLR